MKIQTSAFARSDKGRYRGNNEDNFFLNGFFMPLEDMDAGGGSGGSFTDHVQLFAVCDGIGGAACGEKASFAAVSGLAGLGEAISAGQSVRSAIDQRFEKLNESVLETAGGRNGSTIVLLCLHGKRAHVAHLGDSRAYLLRAGKLRLLTRDHSEARRMVELGIMTEEEAKLSPGRNRLYRYLGIPDDERRPAPDYAGDLRLRAGDVFLLCSDGVYGALTPEEITALLSGQPEGAAIALVETALKNGSRDNATALTVRIERTGGIF